MRARNSADIACSPLFIHVYIQTLFCFFGALSHNRHLWNTAAGRQFITSSLATGCLALKKLNKALLLFIARDSWRGKWTHAFGKSAKGTGTHKTHQTPERMHLIIVGLPMILPHIKFKTGPACSFAGFVKGFWVERIDEKNAGNWERTNKLQVQKPAFNHTSCCTLNL